jgi:hypothetical protein
MLITLQVVTVVLVAIAMSLALAHALELPGKMRLSRDQYLAVQPIYYPGFSIGGAAEPFAIVLLFVLLVMTPFGSTGFWLEAAAFAALAAMHATYWLLTHPVNNFWLKDVQLKGVGAGFFSFNPLAREGADAATDWSHLRDRWEMSHVVRAALGVASLILLVIAIAI